jgi:hypothetical protein
MINWFVLLYYGTQYYLAFLGYASQEVIVVLLNAGHSIL